MPMLIIIYHDILQFLALSVQEFSYDFSKMLARSCQYFTKISLEGQPGELYLLYTFTYIAVSGYALP